MKHQWTLDSLQRFRLFFSGLVFAILSFSIQFAIQQADVVVKWLQGTAWFFLLFAGFFALKDAGGFVSEYNERSFDGLKPKTRIIMWVLFALSIILLGVARILSMSP